MTPLADDVLPLIRSRAELWRWHAANQHGAQMHQAIDLLEAALPTTDAAEAYAVAHKALASAVKVIARADDSSGIIGDACHRLLALHPLLAAAASVAPRKLVDWMMRFQLEGDVDYFELDPVAYAPALGDQGMALYRRRLDEVRERVGPAPADATAFDVPHRHERWVLEWNDRRLAVHDRDVDAIIRTHARDRRVAAWHHDTAKALEEIGELDLAIDWARQAVEHGRDFQSLRASDYWCSLLEQHRPAEALEARLLVFRHWPSSSTAAALHRAAGPAWPEHRDEVLAALEPSPRDAVQFAQSTLKDVELAWRLAHSLGLRDAAAWRDLCKAYERIDALAVLPVYRELVEAELLEARAQQYGFAARRLARMRRIAAGTDEADAVARFIAELRERYYRRPRLQQEFDRAGLP